MNLIDEYHQVKNNHITAHSLPGNGLVFLRPDYQLKR